MIPVVKRGSSASVKKGAGISAMVNGRSASTVNRIQLQAQNRAQDEVLVGGFTRVDSEFRRAQSACSDEMTIDISVLHARVPPEHERLLDMMVEKMCAEDRYKARRLIATQDCLLFSKRDSGKAKLTENYNTIVDSIPLHEVSKVFLAENGSVLEMTTVSGGFNSGRPYVLRMDSEVEKEDAIEGLRDKLKTLVGKAVWREAAKVSPWLHRQHTVKTYYDSRPAQMFVALLIGANFVVNAVEKEYNPEPGTELRKRLDILEFVFTFTFTAELLINAFSHWFKEFIYDGWNQFDTVVVTVSIASVAINALNPSSQVPGLSVLRLLRAFRVMRLFGRLEAQRRIIAAISSSLEPVLHALVIVALIISIYSILAVDFFREREPLFSNLTEATFTMFQVATFEGWSNIARSLFSETEAGVVEVDIGVFFFFGSYIAIVSWTLLPVVVALLLDNFTQVSMQEKTKLDDEWKNSRRTIAHVLDPLLAKMSHFNTASDLSARIATLYHILDVDDSGGLSYKELFEGLKKLNLNPGVHLSKEDYEIMTDEGKLCNENGELGPANFETILRIQLRLYIERNVEGAMRMQPNTDGRAIYSSLKIIMLELDEVRRRVLSMEASKSTEPTEVQRTFQGSDANLHEASRKRHSESSYSSRKYSDSSSASDAFAIQSAHTMIQKKTQLQEGFANSLMPQKKHRIRSIESASDEDISVAPDMQRSHSETKLQSNISGQKAYRRKMFTESGSCHENIQSIDSGSATGSKGDRSIPPPPTIRSGERYRASINSPLGPHLELELDQENTLLPPALGSSLKRKQFSDEDVAAMASPAVRQPLFQSKFLTDSMIRDSEGKTGLWEGVLDGVDKDDDNDGSEVDDECIDLQGMGDVIEQSGAC